MRATIGRHSLDGCDVAILEVERHAEAGEKRFAIDQNPTGRALAQLASMLGSGQSHVLSEDLEQRFVGRDHERRLLAVDAQAHHDPLRDRHRPTLPVRYISNESAVLALGVLEVARNSAIAKDGFASVGWSKQA